MGNDKKIYQKKIIKDKDRTSETEEHPDTNLKKITLPDFTSQSSEGGDYTDHTAEEINPTQRDIQQASAPMGIDSSGFPVYVDWSQMAIVTNRLYGGRTREGIKNDFDFTKILLSGHYICLNCHKLYDFYSERCDTCGSLTTARFNKNPEKTKRKPFKATIINPVTDHAINFYVKPYPELPRAFEYIRDLCEKSKEQLQEVPGTRLKSAGQHLPGIYAYKTEIDNLREPFAQWLNNEYCYDGGYNQTIFQYVTHEPEIYTIYSKTYTVVTNYLERLKLIRLQLWYELYHSIGGLGDFKSIKKVTIDKQEYIKLSVPDAAGYYSYAATHPPSNKIILILSPEPDPELDAVEDIQPVKIGRSDRVKAQLNLSKKNILYESFKKAYHALIFEKDDLIIVIPQEKSFIFPMDIDDLKKWDKYYSIMAGSTLSERNPSGPTRMYKEYDLDDFYSEF